MPDKLIPFLRNAHATQGQQSAQVALMTELNRTQQQTFVLVTHDPRIGAMTNRIIRMKDGRIVGDEAQ